MKLKTIFMSAVAGATLATAAFAQDVTLRIQTHYATEHPTGKMLATWIDDVETMSGGEISIEMFYSSSVVATVETFDAAINGILDCDATGGAYQTGKNPAFQFVGDIMGGYDTPWQQYSWLLQDLLTLSVGSSVPLRAWKQRSLKRWVRPQS